MDGTPPPIPLGGFVLVNSLDGDPRFCEQGVMARPGPQESQLFSDQALMLSLLSRASRQKPGWNLTARVWRRLGVAVLMTTSMSSSLSAQKDPEADIIREQIKEVVSILSTKKMTPLVLPRMKFILTGLIREMKSREMLEVALDDEKVEKAVLPQILILDPISEVDRQAKLDLLLDLNRDITDAQQKVGVIDALLSHALEEVGKSSVDPNKWAAALYRDIRKRFAENSDKVEEKRKWKILIDISSQELSFAKDARMISFLQGFLDLLERGVPHDTPARLQTVVTAPPSAPKSEESKKESKATISPPGGWLRFMSLGTLSLFLTVYGLWMAISDARHQRPRVS